jgi:hypothetical protein
MMHILSFVDLKKDPNRLQTSDNCYLPSVAHVDPLWPLPIVYNNITFLANPKSHVYLLVIAF